MVAGDHAGIIEHSIVRQLQIVTRYHTFTMFHTYYKEKTVFLKLTLRKHIIVAEDDIPKTAVSTPFGLFEFVRMPFGLRNAGQTFQRFMHKVLEGLEYCFPYMDDILVASESKLQHEDHLRQCLNALTDLDYC